MQNAIWLATLTKKSGTKVSSKVRSGGHNLNENQAMVRGNQLKTKTGIRAGGWLSNENQTLSKSATKVRSKSKVRSGVKAGKLGANENQTLKKSSNG